MLSLWRPWPPRPSARRVRSWRRGCRVALIYLGECAAAREDGLRAAGPALALGAAAARGGRRGLHRCRLDAKAVYGHSKEGAKFGHTKIQSKSVLVRGLNALIGTVSTPLVAAVRLRGGNAPSARGVASLAAHAIGTARACGATGTIRVRMDSAYYAAAVIAAIRRSGARFSVTAPVSAAIRAAIAAISQGAWQPIEYPQAIWDDQLGCWVSDAEAAEIEYAAFTSNKDDELHVTARLSVRRVRDKAKAAPGQGELFPTWRYHAVFTDSAYETLQAEEQHRSHAVIEQLLADLSDGLSRTCHPRSSPPTPPGWATAAITHNLLRAAGTLAGCRHPRARAVTIRRDLIAVAARTARHGRGKLTLHLPDGWHRQQEWLNLFESRLRATRRSGLTSPDPVRTPMPPGQPAPGPRTSTPDKLQNPSAAGKHALKAHINEKPAM